MRNRDWPLMIGSLIGLILALCLALGGVWVVAHIWKLVFTGAW